VLLARAVGGRAKNSAITSRLVWMRFMTFLLGEIIDTSLSVSYGLVASHRPCLMIKDLT
jgi:hypothetical protein